MATPSQLASVDQQPSTGKTPSAQTRRVDDWEDWDDDTFTPTTPIDASEQVLISPPPQEPFFPQAQSRTLHPNHAQPRRSSKRLTAEIPSRVRRVKSRQRQKTQNAKAGIRLITDLSTYRRQPQTKPSDNRNGGTQSGKFVDAAALRALEGEPSSASVGNWNWWKKNKDNTPDSATPKEPRRSPGNVLSPQDRPIPIGIHLEPSESRTSAEPSGQRDLHVQHSPSQQHQVTEPHQSPKTQPKSVWSPDSPETLDSFHGRQASSTYSQVSYQPAHAPSLSAHLANDVPPVPALPANYQKKATYPKLVSLVIGTDKVNSTPDESGTPCTLFEEDGNLSPFRHAKSQRSLSRSALTPESATSRSRGWWDHIVTPFVDKRFTFTSRSIKLDGPEEKGQSTRLSSAHRKSIHLQVPSPTTPLLADHLDTDNMQDYEHSTEATRSLPHADERSLEHQLDHRDHDHDQNYRSEKRVSFHFEPTHTEQPPPYSSPEDIAGGPVRYRAVFPPGHPLQAQYPPSPEPTQRGLAHTMTSQGGSNMTEIPLTPARDAPLPIRAAGTFVPQEHSHDTRGDHRRVERRRQRYEKEERAARRAGSLWRGRGCVPKSGCFGRSGREGRKRRRVRCTMCLLTLVLMILIIVLSTVLTRSHHAKDIPSIWVNLTDFPPMPTGALTFVGPDNTEDKSICTEPSTLWSCALPKDDHTSVAPYKPNQPTLVFQIQWDNATRESWDVADGDAPSAVSRRGAIESLSFDGFTPDPSPPSYEDMWFLGETTDSIKSDKKAGEATPFFISLIDSVTDNVTTPAVKRREDGGNGDDNGSQFGNTPLRSLLPKPDLLSDGTPAPAVLFPKVVQQPVRLYDRDLPTEHYGFYTYFSRTLFLKSVTVLNDTTEDDGDVPLDEDGGCSKTEADFLTTWSQTRLLVQIWTRTQNDSSATLLEPDGLGGINGSAALVRPGTMPYPVTVTLDTHGGDAKDKFVWATPMNDRQQVDLDNMRLLSNDIGNGGNLVNPRDSGDAKYGGFDGGTGGCSCQWVNWV